MKITITYKAFGDRPEIGRFITSAEFDYQYSHDDKTILSLLYTVTNLQCDLAGFGYPPAYSRIWKTIESVLDPKRTHTSLSIGDGITLADTKGTRQYRCASTGWDALTVAGSQV